MEMMPAIDPDLADRVENEVACAYCLRKPVFYQIEKICEQCRLEVRLSGGTPIWKTVQGIRDRYKQQTVDRRKERYGR